VGTRTSSFAPKIEKHALNRACLVPVETTTCDGSIVRPCSADARSAMMESFRRRRDAGLSLLRAADARVVVPMGAFYFFIRVGTLSEDDPSPGNRFAEALLDRAGVAVVPGSAFHTSEWIRVSFAAADDDVTEGIRRVIASLRS
jgi:aspartate aminotransferase